jgi:hypothetical protein
VDLGSVSFSTSGVGDCSLGCAGYVARHEASLTSNIVRAGINYSFGTDAPIVARY